MLKIHFLNVGDGDCTLIDFPSRILGLLGPKIEPRLMMVDTFQNKNSTDYENVAYYYKKNFSNIFGNPIPIFRFVLSHPHKDHLMGIKELFDTCGMPINFWDLDHGFEPDKTGPEWQEYKDDWHMYVDIRKTDKVRRDPYVLRYSDSNKYAQYWNEDGIKILSPSRELYFKAHYKEDGSQRQPEEVLIHSMPYVLLINFFGIRILLPGDADETCWQYILEKHKSDITNIDILKAAHHGRDSGFHEEAVKVMQPKRVIFSIAKGSDELHGIDYEYTRVVPQCLIYKTYDTGNLVLQCGFDGNVTAIKQRGLPSSFFLQNRLREY